MKRHNSIFAKAIMIALLAVNISMAKADDWVTTWTTAPMQVATKDVPAVKGTQDVSYREFVRTSVEGKKLRIKFSNMHSNEPQEIKSIYIAYSDNGPEIDQKSARYLTFNGKRSVTIAKGETVWCDPLKFKVSARQRIAITVNVGKGPKNPTGHPGSRTTTYVIEGESTPATQGFADGEQLVRWYFATQIDVQNKKAEAIAVLGNSITDGYGCNPDKEERWTDAALNVLQRDAKGKNIALLNLGIGGNAVAHGGLGPMALKRFDTDILGQSRLKSVVIFEAINDALGSRDSVDAEKRAERVIASYREFAEKVHAKGCKIYICTLTPIGGYGASTPAKIYCREIINKWITNESPRFFDGVIDTESVVVDPQSLKEDGYSARQLKKYWNDGLHPSTKGYVAIGEYVAEYLLKTL